MGFKENFNFISTDPWVIPIDGQREWGPVNDLIYKLSNFGTELLSLFNSRPLVVATHPIMFLLIILISRLMTDQFILRSLYHIVPRHLIDSSLESGLNLQVHSLFGLKMSRY